MKKATKYLIPFLLLLLLLIKSTFSFAQLDINLLEAGAFKDGKTLNTELIQQCIDKIHEKGGGKLIFPKGSYLSGSIILKSNVTLKLERGSILLGSTDPNDYKQINSYKALILADHQTNIGLIGEGTVDGQGRELALRIDSLHHAGVKVDPKYNYRRMRPNETARAQLINFKDCSQILVEGVKLQNASCWVQTYDLCSNVKIHDIEVNSTAYWNNDGIDISDCKNVHISNCFINAADDGICLKSHDNIAMNDSILIENCTVRSSASAVKFGTASSGGFKDITIRNIKAYDTFRSIIALESVDGGKLENVFVSDIYGFNIGNPIFLRLGHRNKDGKIGSLKNVTIKNVFAKVAFERPDKKYDLRGPEVNYFHNPFPSPIVGLPSHPIENVHLENIEIIYPGRATKGMAYVPVHRLAQVPERLHDYPEYTMFGELPSWGFYIRHVKGIKLENVTLRLEEIDFRPSVVFDDVKNISLKNVKLDTSTYDAKVVLNNVDTFIVEASREEYKGDGFIKKINRVENINLNK